MQPASSSLSHRLLDPLLALSFTRLPSPYLSPFLVRYCFVLRLVPLSFPLFLAPSFLLPLPSFLTLSLFLFVNLTPSLWLLDDGSYNRQTLWYQLAVGGHEILWILIENSGPCAAIWRRVDENEDGNDDERDDTRQEGRKWLLYVVPPPVCVATARGASRRRTALEAREAPRRPPTPLDSHP